MRLQRRTPGPLPGVFVSALLFCCLTAQAAVDCAPQPPLQTVRVQRVIDGDTVQLRGGERVRLIGLNAPEKALDGRPAEPQAARAAQALTDLLRDRDIYLQPGSETHDRHGRRLAHLFLRRDGGSVEAELLRRGLGFQVAIPPNTDLADCLQRAEQTARAQRTGVWAERHFAPRDSRTLQRADAGFRRVQLRIDDVQKTRGGWWLEGGQLSVRLDAKALPTSAARCAPGCWRGRSVTLRGWLIDRGDDRAVRERGHPPLLLRIDHPAMIETTPDGASD